METSIRRRLESLHKAETPLLDPWSAAAPPHVSYPAGHSIQAHWESVNLDYKKPGLFRYHFRPAQATAGLEQPDEVCHEPHDHFDKRDGCSDDERDHATVLEQVACVESKLKQAECKDKIRKQVNHTKLLLQTARGEEMWVMGFTHYSLSHELLAQEHIFEQVCLDSQIDNDEELKGKT